MTHRQFEERLRALREEKAMLEREIAELNRGTRAKHLRALFHAVSTWETAHEAFRRADVRDETAYQRAIADLELAAYRVRQVAVTYVRSVEREKKEGFRRRFSRRGRAA